MAGKNTAPVAAGAIAVAVVCLGVGLARCDARSAPATPKAANRPAEKVYPSRGRIVMLPSKGHPTAELVIMHEAIDDFINPNGTRGMGAMEMPLPPAPEIPLGEFAVGDIVEFDLSVWYKPEFSGVERYRVTRMRRLPADTELTFRSAKRD